MPFSENLKLEVRRRAAFQCCICHETGVDIHHIVPQSESGLDDLDNAAPLCQNCHDRFGANAEKRKMIREMRDWWYEVCDKKYKSGPQENELERINETVAEIKRGQEQLIPTLMSQMQTAFAQMGKIMSPSDAAFLGSAFMKASTVGFDLPPPGFEAVEGMPEMFMSSPKAAAESTDAGVHNSVLCKKCGKISEQLDC